jgi:hypothetical protein
MVAFFGASQMHEDDPERAVLAALSMQRALQSFAARENVELKLRVGVNTGEVIVDTSATRRPYSETAMGIAVTIASRMENSAEPGSVLVSEYTHRYVESQFEWQPLGNFNVRGISQPIAVFRPLSPKAETELEQTSDSPFPAYRVGRDAEFLALKQCVEDALSGRGRIVLLTGDKGLGKSSLVNDLREYYAHRSELLKFAETDGEKKSLTWLRGRCRSFHQDYPFAMWIDLLQNWLNAQQLSSKEETRDRLREKCIDLWGDGFAEHYPFLAALLRLAVESPYDEQTRYLDAGGLNERSFIAVRSWIEAMCKRSPLVLYFADTQWASASSLEWLRSCLPMCETEPLLVLLAARQDRELPIWSFTQFLVSEYPHRLLFVELQPLSEAQSVQLIESFVGRDALPQDTRDLIVKNAAGNPYHLRELIESLVTSGALARDGNGDWHATRTIATLDVPDNLQRLLMTRIDRLTTAQRFTLQAAAVIGSVFWSNVLQAVVGDAQPQLTALQRAQMIQETGRAPMLGMQYLFQSPLLREAAYETLLTTQRIALHSKTVEYLELRVGADAMLDYYGVLAHHCRGAENKQKELFYALLAAEQARKIYANTEAIQHYSRALELLDEIQKQNGLASRSFYGQKFEALKARSEILADTGNLISSEKDARALLKLAEELSSEPAWTIDALLAQPELNAVEGSREDFERGLQQAEQALSLARQIGDSRRELLGLLAMSRSCYFLRRPEAHDLSARALALAKEIGDTRAQVNLLLSYGMAFGMDDLQTSQAFLQEAIALAGELDDPSTEMQLLGAISPQFERQGDYYRQLTDYELKRLSLARKIGQRFSEGASLMVCGQIQGIYLGDLDGGLKLEREAFQKLEMIETRLFVLLRIAQIQIMQGELSAAAETLEQARPLSVRSVKELGRAGFGLVEAIYCNAVGDETHLRRALAATTHVHQLVSENLVSRQYRMAAACLMSESRAKLACIASGDQRVEHAKIALDLSGAAFDLYQQFGFAQIVECTSEEIFFRHSVALDLNRRENESRDMLKRAYDEMMRKRALIPEDSPFFTTFLENVPLHREIRARAVYEKVFDS